MHRTIKYFSKSTIGKTAFNRIKQSHCIGRGLVAPGKTRFAGNAHAAESIQRCHSIIEEVTTNPALNMPLVREYIFCLYLNL